MHEARVWSLQHEGQLDLTKDPACLHATAEIKGPHTAAKTRHSQINTFKKKLFLKGLNFLEEFRGYEKLIT